MRDGTTQMETMKTPWQLEDIRPSLLTNNVHFYTKHKES